MLQLDNVSKKLGNFALKNINLDVNEGEYFIILGPTGTGKTVILELIAGMYSLDTGRILFKNQVISDLYPEERGIGFVYQDYALFPHLSVKDNITFGLRIRKRKKAEIDNKLDELVSLLKIEHLLDRFPTTLSGGEQQRTAIARALMTSPQILLLDEPLSALDPQTKLAFQDELKKIHEILGTTTMHITHDFAEALALADRLAVMHNGEIVQTGEPSQVFRQPVSLFVAWFVGAENILNGHVNSRGVELTADIVINCPTHHKGDITLTIRPEDITLSQEPEHLEGRNILPGTITRIIDQGPVYRITFDAGIPLTALVSHKTAAELALAPGMPIWASFDQSSIHVIQ